MSWSNPTAQRLQEAKIELGLPDTPTKLTFALRYAPSNEGPYAATWDDKPHRLLYTACREIERQAGVVAKLVEALKEADGILRAVSTDWEAAQVKVIEALALAKGEAA